MVGIPMTCSLLYVRIWDRHERRFAQAVIVQLTGRRERPFVVRSLEMP